jgi:ABC-type transport system involved in multi-copper enzyme maturation permease subunit
VKIRAIAASAFGILVRNKLILIFCAVFLCVVLLFMTPLLLLKSMANSMGAETATQMALSEITAVLGIMSGFGSLLAAWAAADAAASEVRSGTILAVLARPVRRWEFLLGKFLGVMAMMAIYVVFLVGMTYLLAAISGQSIHGSPLPLLIYPLIRYAVYAAIGMLFGVLMHPMAGFGLTLLVAYLASAVGPAGSASWMPGWLRTGLYVALPSTRLLSEDRFVELTQSPIHGVLWKQHLISLVYGVDYAVVCFLLAAWAFRRKSLARE